jgi:hypothetical protein
MTGKIKYKVPHLYSFLYKKIKETYRSNYIKMSDFIETLSRTYRIPKIYHYGILYEMEQYKLLKKIHRMKIRVLRNDCDKKLDSLRIVDFWD